MTIASRGILIAFDLMEIASDGMGVSSHRKGLWVLAEIAVVLDAGLIHV